MSLVLEAEGLQWEAKFVQNMARRRKEIGMTQVALARLLSDRGLAFHQQTVQRIENGERPVRLNEAVLIVQALGLGDEDGRLGLDAAIDPQINAQTAAFLLREALARARRLVAASEMQRQESMTWARTAAADLAMALFVYQDAVQGTTDADEALVVEAADEARALRTFVEKLQAVDPPSDLEAR